MRAATLEATVLKFGSVAGIIFPGYGSRTGIEFAVPHGTTPPPWIHLVVDGSKIAPCITGRPRTSKTKLLFASRTWSPVRSELKSPALNASIGVVLPKPGR